ncbi:MAG: archaemetzincin family Zn-dependent metalloprotease [Terriglobales bacterium]
MNLLQLVRVGECDPRTLDRVGPALSQRMGVPWDVLPSVIDVDFALHAERQQYHSTEILGRMKSLHGPHTWRMLGITDLDLYIPILTFVFGEAEMGGRVAIVSTQRLRQEFYGLPADEEAFHERVLKEALHELGHTLDLRHCDDYRCAMAASHAVEWIDLKGANLCSACMEKIAPAPKKRLWPF